jgi:hypothetical protein
LKAFSLLWKHVTRVQARKPSTTAARPEHREGGSYSKVGVNLDRNTEIASPLAALGAESLRLPKAQGTSDVPSHAEHSSEMPPRSDGPRLVLPPRS